MKKIELMTHVVLGYRTLEESEALVILMAEKGVDYIEMQIPFSDPIGDGSTITMANQYALDHGTTVSGSLSFIARMCRQVNTPILIMTYSNIVYKYGYEAFFKRAKDIGVQGAIIPDLPFLTEDKSTLSAFEHADRQGIFLVPVISPNTNKERMQKISDKMKMHNNDFMVYCTQRTGVTGTHVSHRTHAETYLENARDVFHAKIAGGFGISSAEKVAQLIGQLDIAVIGSHIMNLYKGFPVDSFDHGLEKVSMFLDEVNAIR